MVFPNQVFATACSWDPLVPRAVITELLVGSEIWVQKGKQGLQSCAVLWVFICSLKFPVFLNMRVFNLNTIWFCWPMQCWYFYPNLYVFLCALPGLVLGKWLECCWVSAAGIMSWPTFPVSLGYPCIIGRKKLIATDNPFHGKVNVENHFTYHYICP